MKACVYMIPLTDGVKTLEERASGELRPRALEVNGGGLWLFALKTGSSRDENLFKVW